MQMHSHPVGLDVWFLVGPFVYFHTLCVQTAKALAKLRGCQLYDKYHNLMSWLTAIYCCLLEQGGRINDGTINLKTHKISSELQNITAMILAVYMYNAILRPVI